MQCMAIAVDSRERCKRRVRPGTRYCTYHGPAGHGQARGDQTEEGDSPLRALVPAQGEGAQARGVGDEIVLLRSQIREAFEQGDTESVRRGIDTLCKALRVQHVLDGRSAESLSGSIARVLEEVGAELGVTL